MVPYQDEVEVSHELGGRLGRAFSSFDEHGQFFDHRNRGNSLHTDWLTLLKGEFVNESSAPDSSIRASGIRQNLSAASSLIAEKPGCIKGDVRR